MYLEQLHLQNVRNLADSSLTLGPGFNYIHGANGAGKTAILEAAFLLSRGRSFRTHKASTIIRHGESEMLVRGEVLGEPISLGGKLDEIIDSVEANPQPAPISAKHSLAMSKSKAGVTQIRVNGEHRTRLSELARLLPIQVMLPDAAELIFGSPARRREFLDWGLFHVERQFLGVAAKYNRLLAQRNAWLKTSDPGHFRDDPWVGQLLQYGQQISAMRYNFVAPLQQRLTALIEPFDLPVGLELSYLTGGSESEALSAEKMSESWARDVKFGITHKGPHREDLHFTLSDIRAGEILSRGQAKLVACTSVLAQIDVLRQHHGVLSIVLIDDFGAELDVAHWRQFTQMLHRFDCQVIATSTQEPQGVAGVWGSEGDFKVFHVEHGNVQVH